MFWFVYAIFGALCDATHIMLIKRLLNQKINLYILGSVTCLCTFLILFCISILYGIPHLGPVFYSSVLITVSLNVVATILYFKVLQTTDLSLAVPMMAFTPVFLILTSSLVLQETP